MVIFFQITRFVFLGERDGMESSLKHAQEIATSRKTEIDELEVKVENSELEKERMHGERNEVSLEKWLSMI